MPTSTRALEHLLESDLDQLFATLTDDWSSIELYRALSRTGWSKSRGHLSLTRSEAEALINRLRTRHGKRPLELSQSGGEGEVSERACELLLGIGWTRRRPRRFERRRSPRPEPAGTV